MQLISSIVSFILHIDVHLAELVAQYGPLTYGILFSIVFAETGFIVTPFLPGDSLLFAIGALSALGSFNLWLSLAVLATAAILGDTVNYWIGHFFGQKIVDNPNIPFINQEHIDKTQAFYKKHGGKTIVLARFVPIVRTFAPFVAGIGKMDYSQFFLYNIVGGLTWVFSFTLLGYFFGNLPAVKENFTFAVLGIIAVSVLPMVWEFVKEKRSAQHSK